MNILNYIARVLFHYVILPFVMFVWVGMNIRHRRNLPKKGPAIIVANHNSHFDTFALMALFPPSVRMRMRPVADEGYFSGGGFRTWFALSVLRGITVKRGSGKGDVDPFLKCHEAIDQDDLLIIYPEGSRGEPEVLQPFKKGIAHLAARHPNVPIIPVFLKGLGRVLGKGSVVPMLLFCDATVGPSFHHDGPPDEYVAELQKVIVSLGNETAR